MQVVGCLCNGHPLLDAPTNWGTATVTVIGARQRASGRGIVKKCLDCKRWVDVTFAERQAVA